MKPTDQHIDDLFRKGMEGYSEVPPTPVWDTIEQRLDEKNRRRILFWPLLLLIVAGGIVISAKYIRHNQQLNKLPPETEKGLSIRSIASEMDQKSKLPLNKKANKNTTANTDSSYEEQLATTKSAKAKVVIHADNQLDHSLQTVSKENRKPASSDIRLTNAAPSTAHNFGGNRQSDNVPIEKDGAQHPAGKAPLKAILQHSDPDSYVSQSRIDSDKKGRVSESIGSLPSTTQGEAVKKPQSPLPNNVSGGVAVHHVPKGRSDTRVDRSGRSGLGKELIADLSSRVDSAQLEQASDKEEVPMVPGELVSSVKQIALDSTKFEKLAESKTIADSSSESGITAESNRPPRSNNIKRKRLSESAGAENTQSPIPKDTKSNKESSSAVQSKRQSSQNGTEKESLSNIEQDITTKGRQQEKDSSGLGKGIAGNPDGMQAIGKAPREKESTVGKKNFPFVFRLGLMAGRESGFSSFTANKTVLDVFFEWTIFRNFGLSIAPAYKWAKTNQDYTISDGNYVQAGNTEVRMFNPEKDSMGGLSGYASYAFAQTFDSMTATKTLGRSYREVELPLSLFYRITKNWTISAGCNMVWGAAPKFSGSVDKINGLRLEDTVRNYFDLNFKGPDPAAKFSHAGVDTFGAYKDPGNDPTNKPFRLGYVFSVRYAHRYGINAELSMRQQAGGLSAITDAQLKSLLSQPFFRLSIGYEIGRSKK
jgi:uncharacterized protein YneF (UPF0154 family)